MRITLISPWGSPCGISVYAGDVYAELASRGHEVQVLAYEESMPAEVKLNLPVHRVWKIGQSPGWQVMHQIHEFKPDIIHVQHEIGLFCPGAIWREWLECLRATNVPVVVTYHSLPDVPTVFTDLPVSLAVVCSPIGSTILSSRVDFPVMTIEHGVDGSIPRERPVEPYSLASFGFLSECKGYHRILEAMHLLRSELPQLNLTIMGALSPRAYGQQLNYFRLLHRRVHELGLTGQVDLSCGFRTQREVQACLSRKAVGLLHYDRTDRMSVAADFLDERSDSAVRSMQTSSPVSQATSPASQYFEYGRSSMVPPPEGIDPFEELSTSGALFRRDGYRDEFAQEGTVDEAMGIEALATSGSAARPHTSIRAGRARTRPLKPWLPQMGTAGVRCQSAALYRMWSAGLPCIVSQAQHFDVGAPAEEAVIRASDVPQLADQIRRMFVEPDAYTKAVSQLASRLTRTWKDVADDYEQALSLALTSN